MVMKKRGGDVQKEIAPKVEPAKRVKEKSWVTTSAIHCGECGAINRLDRSWCVACSSPLPSATESERS